MKTKFLLKKYHNINSEKKWNNRINKKYIYWLSKNIYNNSYKRKNKYISRQGKNSGRILKWKTIYKI